MKCVSIKTYFFPLLVPFLFVCYSFRKKERRQQTLMQRPFVYRLLWLRNDNRQIPSLKQFLSFARNSNECACVWYQSHLPTPAVQRNWHKHQPCSYQRLWLSQMRRWQMFYDDRNVALDSKMVFNQEPHVPDEWKERGIRGVEQRLEGPDFSNCTCSSLFKKVTGTSENQPKSEPKRFYSTYLGQNSSKPPDIRNSVFLYEI